MDDEYIEVEIRGTTIRTSKSAYPRLKDTAERLDAYLSLIGEITWNFASLNERIDQLFEPLLICSSEQVACIMVDNIGTRCDQIIRLLHLDQTLGEQFRDWLTQLLTRVSRELAEERNRYMHDKWGLDVVDLNIVFVRTDKRPKVAKAQSRKPPMLETQRKSEVHLHDLKNLSDRIATVEYALAYAKTLLETWRQKEQIPLVDQQWIPACKRNALGWWDEPMSTDNQIRPPPLRYE